MVKKKSGSRFMGLVAKLAKRIVASTLVGQTVGVIGVMIIITQ